jgi:CTP-dependent riboflavin kinase
MTLTKILLKNGIKEMISENEDHFKKNIEYALSLKLNDSIREVKNTVSEKLFENHAFTKNSEELQEFIKFTQEAGQGKAIFQDGSLLNITEKQIELVKSLFESLNAKNRTHMVKEVLQSSTKFKQHVNFAEKIKGLQ